MAPDFIFLNNTLVIPGLPLQKKIIYVLRILTPCIIAFLIVLLSRIHAGWFVIITVFLMISFKNYIFIPVVFYRIVISKQADAIFLNRKKMEYADLMFLSIRERDDYKVIRLEGKRKNIIRANEKILKSDCRDFEHAYMLCNTLRDFIDPALKINHIKVGYSRAGVRKKGIEIWELQ